MTVLRFRLWRIELGLIDVGGERVDKLGVFYAIFQRYTTFSVLEDSRILPVLPPASLRPSVTLHT